MIRGGNAPGEGTRPTRTGAVGPVPSPGVTVMHPEHDITSPKVMYSAIDMMHSGYCEA